MRLPVRGTYSFTEHLTTSGPCGIAGHTADEPGVCAVLPLHCRRLCLLPLPFTSTLWPTCHLLGRVGASGEQVSKAFHRIRIIAYLLM
jgi:hypothetical protein